MYVDILTLARTHIPELYYTSGTRPLRPNLPANQRRDSLCDVIASSTTRGSPGNSSRWGDDAMVNDMK